MQRQDFDSDSVISESESQTRHLTSSRSQPDIFTKFENRVLLCCGPRIGKIFLAHKEMWICIVLSIIYYGFGVAYYASVEKWDLITTIYFITISFLAIGYGFVVPGSDNSRIFTAFYVSGGIVLMAFTLNNICRSWLSAHLNAFVDYLSPSNNLDEKYMKHLIAGVMLIFLLFFVGLIYFSSAEPWTSADVFYFVVTSMTTVGYGDFVASTDGSRMFLVAWMYWCMTAYYHTLNNVVNSYDVVKAGLISRMNSMREIELGQVTPPPSFAGTNKSQNNPSAPDELVDTFGIAGGVSSSSSGGVAGSNDARNAFVLDQLIKRGIINPSTLDPIVKEFNDR